MLLPILAFDFINGTRVCTRWQECENVRILPVTPGIKGYMNVRVGRVLMLSQLGEELLQNYQLQISDECFQ